MCNTIFSFGYQAGFSVASVDLLFLQMSAGAFFFLFLLVFGLFYFSFAEFAKVASLLSWSFCQSLLFHTLMFLFPLLSIMLLLPPVSAMHLGNQEMDSDVEDEVNHTLPTMCYPLC